MTTVELSLALFALLATPGPTNTLMFLTGAEQGAARGMRLIPAELAGYLLTVIPLTLLGSTLLGLIPAAREVIAIGAGLWVAVLALRLWRPMAPQSPTPPISAKTVFVTTLLNPKALIFGLVLLPSGGQEWTNIAGFAAQVTGVAALWVGAGALVARRLARRPAGGAALPHLLRRVASVWLGALSLALMVKGLGA